MLHDQALTSYPSINNKITEQGKDSPSIASGQSSILKGKTSSLFFHLTSVLFFSCMSFHPTLNKHFIPDEHTVFLGINREPLAPHAYKTESKIRGYHFTF